MEQLCNMANNLMSDPAYYIVSLVAVAMALGVVTQRNIVRAGLSLVISFGAVAGTYFMMNAPFVAASQILIYAVGITLVIIFGLMLTNSKEDLTSDDNDMVKMRSAFSVAIAFGIFCTFSACLIGGQWASISAPLSCPRNVEIIGLKLLSTYVLPFELVSVLLLVALVGAIVIAKKDKKGVQ